MIALLLAIPVTVWDFSLSNEGFTPYGDTNQWEHGAPSGGPGGAEKLWGTNLNGFYLNDSVDYLEVPVPDLTGVVDPSLVFRHWYAMSPGDYGWVEVEVGGSWTRIEPVYGYPTVEGFTGSADWTETTVDLDVFSGSTRVRFAFAADASFADDGWYLSDVTLWDGDATAPRISPVLEPGDTQNLTSPYKVQVLALDNGVLDEVLLTWSVGGPDNLLTMTHLGNGVYQGLIPPQAPDTIVSWQATAHDGGGNAASWPPTALDTFRVFLAAPTGVTVSYDQRPVGENVTLSWTAPISSHTVQSYTLQDLGGTLDPISVTGTSADLVVHAKDPQLWRVAAEYEAGTGDWSTSVDLNLEVPVLTALTPASAVQGETLHVSISGASLYLLEGVTTLDLGPGIEILDLDVRDVDTLDALVAVHGSAEAGPRDVEILGAQGAASFPGAFEVLDEALGMHIVSVEPGTLTQGATAEVVITASQPFAGPVAVQHGDDLVLQTTPVTTGSEVRFDVAVQNSATPGVHTLFLDDGARVVQAQLSVDERVYQISTTGCQTGAALSTIQFGAGGLALAALLVVGRRRRGLRG